MSAVRSFRQALESPSPLQILGVINAYSAILAQSAGAQAIYLSGAGVANASLGLPDLGVITLNDVINEARKIINASRLPLIVDVDSGFGGALSLERLVRELIGIGAAGLHIEDQILSKRCGHRLDKELIGMEEMQERLSLIINERNKLDKDFYIIARSDVKGSRGMDKLGLDELKRRVLAYESMGVDAIFPEALETLEEYRELTSLLKIPVLANITEFGRTPLFTKEELRNAQVSMILYPLSGFRAASKATLEVFSEILKQGSVENKLSLMQTRLELYEYLNYLSKEQRQ